jgi:hypothetical protein
VVLARELGPLLGLLVLTDLVELLEAEAPPEPLLEVVPEPVLGPVLGPVLPNVLSTKVYNCSWIFDLYECENKII